VDRQEQVAALAGSLSRRTEVLQRALEYDSLEALDLSREPDVEQNVLQSYIRVQRGCDKFCAYCVVPFTRGPERSRPAAHIVQEARTLAERGCREVTLLGQTVNSYVHQEDGQAISFARLLKRVQEVDGIDRVRFVTSYPADWNEDIFRVMRDYPKIMPYLHIPAQSGSDRVLAGMKRGYTADSYRRLMDTARRYVPHIALAGDFIVGFCDETESDFQQSIQLVRDIEYAGLYVFKYSPRPGTRADRHLEDNVPESEKSRRCNELIAVQREIGAARRQGMIGQTVEVLVEGYSRLSRRAQGETKAMLRTRGKQSPSFGADRVNGELRAWSGNEEGVLPESEQDRGSEVSADRQDQLVGRTPHDTITVFDAPPAMIGATVRVYVEDASPHTLFGRLVEVVSPARRGLAPPSDIARSVALPVVG
ncbi:MAG: MiaB/RimO family radical SAM methylthiotransferase, partial [Phycisphaerales bacterium]|nr:MiaB/RimO family radical SAM methylthiotransferase [Phycisphaerales bacterium]